MKYDMSIFNAVGMGLAGLLAIIWCCLRALRRGDSPVGVVLRGLVSLALVAGLELFIVRKFSQLTGGFADDTITVLTIVALIAVCGVLLSVFWAPAIADFLAAPLTNIFDGGHEPPEPKPAYSAAKFQREAGRLEEALTVVREQLARFPNDYEGVMLLASIQAEDMDDLPAAEATLEDYCNARNVPVRRAVAAWLKLVDWYKIRGNADAARRMLEKIMEDFPETEFSLKAERQLAGLGFGKENSERIGSHPIEPGQLASVYVKQLAHNPEDVEAREKLAKLYAQHFKRLDLATMEYEQLIQGPGHSRKQIAGWLHQLANAQIELGADLATATATLEKIAREYADQPLARIAQQRLTRVHQQSINRRP